MKHFARIYSLPIPLAAVLLLGACVKQPEATPDTDSASNHASAGQAGAPGPTSSASSRPTELFGATFTLIDLEGRPLECRAIAKAGEQILVQRSSDKQQFIVELSRLSAASRAELAAFPDTRAEDIQAFVDQRDYAAAKRAVKIEMISASWCGWCDKAKAFFAAEKIPYQVFDYKSPGGESRKRDWNSSSLPTVKIGDHVINGFGEASYRKALLSEYRKSIGQTTGS